MKRVINYTLTGIFIVIMSMSSTSVHDCNYGEDSFGSRAFKPFMS
jgi:hypothetical protein